jgi:energy-coupling factor transport system ATP-binding protein
VLSGFDLTIDAGERLGLVGPSGCGKSTILHALAGVLGDAIGGELRGRVEVGGSVATVLQNPAHAVVAERVGRNVAFGPENRGFDREAIWRIVHESLASVGLTGLDFRRCSQLSGGQQQRLAVSGALAAGADLYVFDEPTGMLDESTAGQVVEAMVSAVGEHTMVVVEHRIEPWLPHLDRIVALDAGGKVSFDGNVEQFRRLDRLDGVWLRAMPVPQPVEPAWAEATPGERVSARDVQVRLTEHTAGPSRQSVALSGFSMDASPQRVTKLTGPSGSGKSTALLALGGLVSRDTGEVLPDLRRVRSRRLAARLGWVPQNPESSFVAGTVAEELARTSRVLRRSIDTDEILASIGLAGRGKDHPYRLSGGEQRRLSLAAALAHQPGIALLDEPTVGQDPAMWAVVAGWISAHAQAGGTVVVSTHDRYLASDGEVRMAVA